MNKKMLLALFAMLTLGSVVEARLFGRGCNGGSCGTSACGTTKKAINCGECETVDCPPTCTQVVEVPAKRCYRKVKVRIPQAPKKVYRKVCSVVCDTVPTPDKIEIRNEPYWSCPDQCDIKVNTRCTLQKP